MSAKKMDPTVSIKAFYAGRSIFITGGTGFMGKILIEKLLRSCPDVREIFLLMRPKRGMSIDDRLRNMLTNPVFDRLKEERPEVIHKLIPVTGDVSIEGLGLPPVERQVVIDRVSVVFHVAANVRFDDNFRNAVFINTRSTRDVCILAANMKNLVALVHVSSTYTHADEPEVHEILYPDIADWKKTIKIAENVDDHLLRILTAKYLKGMPNTYTFTKRLAEQIIKEYAGILPIVLFRPSIVVSTLSEPVRGWLDNFNGPVGMMVGGGKGILRVLFVNPKLSSDYMPVDVAIKAMIVATWKRGVTTITKDPNVHVYNCASSDIKKISTKEIVTMGLRLTENIPLEGIVWLPNTMVTSNKILYYILTLFLHLLPALMIDGILKLSGRKPMLVKLQRKVYAANNALKYFLTHEWKFHNDKLLTLLQHLGPHDVNEFGFEYAAFDIYEYFKYCIIGSKLYLLNEDMNKLSEAKMHRDRMWWIDRIFKIWLSCVVVWLLIRFEVIELLWHLILRTIQFFIG